MKQSHVYQHGHCSINFEGEETQFPVELREHSTGPKTRKSNSLSRTVFHVCGKNTKKHVEMITLKDCIFFFFFFLLGKPWVVRILIYEEETDVSILKLNGRHMDTSQKILLTWNILL